MRKKDEYKQEALFRATVKLVNEIGFVSSSVSKIAGEAGISPATIYIYYKNKEDLLVSTYMAIKKEISTVMLLDVDLKQPIRAAFRKIWYNMFSYISDNRENFLFTEQFSNSSYAALVDKEEVSKHFLPVADLLQRGIDEKIIKDVSMEILGAFIFYTISILSNPNLCMTFEGTEDNVEAAFTMAWDAVKF